MTRLVAVLGYSDASTAELHPVCGARLERAAAEARADDVILFSGWARGRAAAPEAEEGITYSMPGFLLDGHGFVSYAAFDDHYSFFPMSSKAIDAHRDELGSRVTGKGAIRLEYGRRLPTAIVKRVVRTRRAEATAERAGQR